MEGDFGVVDMGGAEYKVNLTLVPDVKIGDYVIVHAGFAINKLDEEDACETLKLFDEING